MANRSLTKWSSFLNYSLCNGGGREEERWREREEVEKDEDGERKKEQLCDVM